MLYQRIPVHGLLCWLARLLPGVIERETEIGDAWAREALKDLALVILAAPAGRIEPHSTEPAEQRKLLRKLDLPLGKA